MCELRPGDMVVCVDFSPDLAGEPVPFSSDDIYTVGSVVPRNGHTREGYIAAEDGVEIDGFPTEHSVLDDGVVTLAMWRASRFRRVLRPDPSLLANLLTAPAPADLVAA